MTSAPSPTTGSVAFATDRVLSDPRQHWTHDEFDNRRVVSTRGGIKTSAKIIANDEATLDVEVWSNGAPDAGADYRIAGTTILPMPLDEQQAIDAIERERRARERELLLLFLIVFGTATRHATMAIRLGHDPAPAARNVIMGNPALGLRGLPDPLAKVLTLAHSDGYRRTDLLAGRRPDLARDEILPEWIDAYPAQAVRMAQGMTDTFIERINETIAEAPPGMNAREVADLVRDAINEHGYGRENPYLLETVAEVGVVNAHNGGVTDAGDAKPDVWGYQFINPLDGRTTMICRTCAGTRLPKGHPWFFTHTPSMHFGCRSLLRPIFVGSPLAVATNAPEISADPGFGRPWFVFKS